VLGVEPLTWKSAWERCKEARFVLASTGSRQRAHTRAGTNGMTIDLPTTYLSSPQPAGSLTAPRVRHGPLNFARGNLLFAFVLPIDIVK
jgi:hypothetical protein